MNAKFGTDGIRGIASADFDCRITFYASKAFGYLCKKKNPAARILIAKDNRSSGSMFECSVASGITSSGADAYLLGVLPTGGASILTRQYGADACIVISASHNPPEYNGIKFFDSQGKKISDETERSIEKLANSLCKECDSCNFGKVWHCKSAKQDYEIFCKKLFFDKSDKKIVIDCSNGAACGFAKDIFSKYVQKLIVIGNDSCGDNINTLCGSTYPQNLLSAVRKHNADAGFAFDGDSDRLVCCDRESIYTGDSILFILANYFKEKNMLPENAVAGTIMTNGGCEKALSEKGIKLYRTDVGDKFLLNAMLEHNLNLGGEDSGHVIIRNCNFTGDGIVTAIHVLNVLTEKKTNLKDLLKNFCLFPQKLESVTVPKDIKFDLNNSELQTEIENCKKLLSDGRIIIRKSGTENKIRIMVEDKDNFKTDEISSRLIQFISTVYRH